MIKSKIQMKQAQVQIQNTNKDTNTNMKTNTNKNTNTNTDWQEAELLAPPCNMASNLHSWPHPLLKHLSLSFIEEKINFMETIFWASHFPHLLVNYVVMIITDPLVVDLMHNFDIFPLLLVKFVVMIISNLLAVDLMHNFEHLPGFLTSPSLA